MLNKLSIRADTVVTMPYAIRNTIANRKQIMLKYSRLGESETFKANALVYELSPDGKTKIKKLHCFT